MTHLFRTYHVDSGAAGPHVVITAGVHGDEYEPMLAAQKLVRSIIDRLCAGRVTIVPVANVSAYQLANRCGEDGMDLARTCPGSLQGTITEQVAFQISALIREASFYIDLHTGGRIFDIFPLAGYMLHQSPEVLDVQRQMAQAFGFPVIWGTDRYAEGRTLSVARDAHVPAIYVEFGGPAPLDQKIVDQYVNGCLNALALFSMLREWEKKETKLVYWVEDHRVNNGHLQSKTPAPAEGVFLPRVELGTTVKAGEIWGTIENPLSGEHTEVIIEADGLVLFKRMSGYVRKNDSLGGLLPLTEPGKIVFNEA